ncbi:MULTISPECIES: zinc-finger domain-containing protein [Heyndrickxia]|uniref:zinc-finger domain-containing protein n=1 Tax=Heyndrickxia TaxID=2837504 RepID=UPI0009FA8DC8|nr:zinc-finger domain-containing protein [Heyndrickxia shackletonii]MBB2481565.1 zinc-finger domain-containing protein [Bacillus sp. APMAM]NEY99905.1 zinc-finger domain-containing protein [Heyndrickxia shackletonii]RTZ55056.1 zinc-finger domain-containing protein [Bacillus sp. SAJ1]
MERKKLLKEVDSIIEYYCEGCFIKSTLQKEHGKTFAHRFCIEKCTVGEKLKEFGKKLN